MTMPDICLMYEVQSEYGVSRSVALTAISFALGGSDRGENCYSGLIDLEELNNIGLKYQKKGGSKLFET